MLIVGVYLKDGKSTSIASFADGERGVVLATGRGCVGVLTQALQSAPLSSELQVYTNYADLVQVYNPPVRLALPDIKTERYSYIDKAGKTQWRTNKVPFGNDAQWDLLRAMSRFYKWSVRHVEDLPTCREWWELNYG
jgi:hypothetical protein